MAKVAIAVHACGFSSKEEICPAFKSRLRRAQLALIDLPPINKGEAIVIITGGVPYEKGARLLADLAGDYLSSLYARCKLPYDTFYAFACFNSSTDAQNVLEICREQKVKRLIVVTSYWHNWMVRQMYKVFNNRSGLSIEFASPMSRDGAGIKTVVRYIVFSLLIFTSRIIGLFNWLDAKLNKSQVKRQKEFQEIGCD